MHPENNNTVGFAPLPESDLVNVNLSDTQDETDQEEDNYKRIIAAHLKNAPSPIFSEDSSSSKEDNNLESRIYGAEGSVPKTSNNAEESLFRLQQDGAMTLDYQKALLEWQSTVNLDALLQELYGYWRAKGASVLFLNQVANLTVMAVVVIAIVGLVWCFDWVAWRRAPPEEALHVTRFFHFFGWLGMPWWSYIAVFLFGLFWVWQVKRVRACMPRWHSLSRIFRELLGVSCDGELGKTTWETVEERIRALHVRYPLVKSQSGTADPLSGSAIAQRIMRQSNYIKSIFTKHVIVPDDKLTGCLEWLLEETWRMTFFDATGQVKPALLLSAPKRSEIRAKMAQDLAVRLRILGFLAVVMSPVVAVFVVIWVVLQYGESILRPTAENSAPSTSHAQAPSNPLKAHQWTRAARWRLRFYNELPQEFVLRLAMANPSASAWTAQQSSSLGEHWIVLARLASFLLSSVLVLLAMLTVMRPDVAIPRFDAEHAPVLPPIMAWTGAVSGALACCRALIPSPPDQNPQQLFREIARKLPGLKEDDLPASFIPKWRVAWNELMGLVWSNAYYLLIALPPASQSLVDWVKNESVHVVDLGYVSSSSLIPPPSKAISFKSRTSKNFVDNKNRLNLGYGDTCGQPLAAPETPPPMIIGPDGELRAISPANTEEALSYLPHVVARWQCKDPALFNTKDYDEWGVSKHPGIAIPQPVTNPDEMYDAGLFDPMDPWSPQYRRHGYPPPNFSIKSQAKNTGRTESSSASSSGGSSSDDEALH